MKAVINLSDYARDVEKRKAELGLKPADFMPNSGERRTPAKRAMLAAADGMMRAQGKALPMASRY